MLILAIESSCDETAASILNNGKIVSNVVLSQEIHKEYGGVVPEIASREHDSQITYIVNRAIDKARVSYHDLNAVAVTYGAGLLGALLVGLSYAKGLSISLNIPFVGVNHLEGHLYASFITNPQIKYPFLTLLVTGGHTQIWEVDNSNKYIMHSNTVDDAAGEAFDKGARILGLSYPGGPEIEKIAKNGNKNKYKFSIPRVRDNQFYYSFSGLKTALLYKYNAMTIDERKKNLSDLAASYQEAIFTALFDKLKKVISNKKIKYICIVGGVAVNKRFRSIAQTLSKSENINIYFPPMEYCTDNAAMIAVTGYEKLKKGHTSSLNLKACPNLSLDR